MASVVAADLWISRTEGGSEDPPQQTGEPSVVNRIMAQVEIRNAGWLTTIQDAGRWGMQRRGVSVSGPMDWFSHRLANLLVGNVADAAALEITMSGPEVVFEGEAWFATTGARFPATMNGAPISMTGVVHARSGDRLKFGLRRRGARGYVAIAGGLLVPLVLGSRSTHVLSRLGGLDGRPLRAGDRIEIGPARSVAERRPHSSALILPDGGARLRVLTGPHQDHFAHETTMKLCSSRYVLSSRSDRMGYRLEGPALSWLPEAPEIISGATVPGAIQVPASGQPILLMADRATTGGYPILAVVISADLPLAGQLAPGEWVEFIPCTRDEAIAALRERERALSTADDLTIDD
jgi:antagonist of KipI